MKTIYKYPLHQSGLQQIEMPSNARILSFQIQNGTPCIWALVDTNNPILKRQFQIFGTGHEIPENNSDYNYIGTCQDGMLVFHCFEVI